MRTRGRPRVAELDGVPTPQEIKAQRIAADLTMAEAAAAAEVALRTWQRWESGEGQMHPAVWRKWADAAVQYVRPTKPPPAPSFGQIVLARKARRLSQEQAAKIAKVATRTWQNWEAGTAKMSGAAWTRWLEATPLPASPL